MDEYISHVDASIALDCLDDYARMDVGVDAHGPRGILEIYIQQQRSESALSKVSQFGELQAALEHIAELEADNAHYLKVIENRSREAHQWWSALQETEKRLAASAQDAEPFAWALVKRTADEPALLDKTDCLSFNKDAWKDYFEYNSSPADAFYGPVVVPLFIKRAAIKEPKP